MKKSLKLLQKFWGIMLPLKKLWKIVLFYWNILLFHIGFERKPNLYDQVRWSSKAPDIMVKKYGQGPFTMAGFINFACSCDADRYPWFQTYWQKHYILISQEGLFLKRRDESPVNVPLDWLQRAPIQRSKKWDL